MSRATSPDHLRFRRLFRVPPKKLFELWTDPASIARWFGGEQVRVAKVELDLRSGGEYAITVRGEQGDSIVSGRFLEVQAPQRLVYTWTLDGPLGRMAETIVTVEFRQTDQGTELLLEHGPFPDEDLRSLHDDGWHACFQALDRLLP